MTTGVSHTFGGNVVVMDMGTGRRWDLSPEMAEEGARKCEKAASHMASSALLVIDCLDGRQFRFGGDNDALLKMADDLTANAAEARLKAVQPTQP